MSEDSVEISKEDLRFYFPVCVWFDGDEIKFQIDGEVILADGFIYNDKTQKWCSAVHGEISNWDNEAFLHLMDKLSNIELNHSGE
jgi:hypothetical protein